MNNNITNTGIFLKQSAVSLLNRNFLISRAKRRAEKKRSTVPVLLNGNRLTALQ